MTPESLAPVSVDFLPRRYMQQEARRHASAFRLFVAVVFGLILVGSSLIQQGLLWQAELDWAMVDSLHTVATKESQRIADLQNKLAQAEQEADLLTYLRHPWPRTQILAAIWQELPPSVTLGSLQIHFEKSVAPTQGIIARSTKEDATDNLSLPSSDLKRLREECDRGSWRILLSGSTLDLASMHQYLATLEKHALFTNIELISIATPTTASSVSQFSAKLTLAPGYGQPKSPRPAITATRVPGGPQ